jgi:tRNA threonylcarbamoyladenosine biosynthesis protein TsaE
MKTYTLEELKEFGKEFSVRLKSGSVVALTGDLGAGKTTLSQSIAAGLGVTEEVTSPTFTIICEYTSGRLPLYHFDLYRLETEEELENLGVDEYFYGRGICLVEWADKVPEALPEDAIWVNIEYDDAQPDKRKITIKDDTCD